MEHLTLPSFSLGQVSWAVTSLEDCLLEKGGNESWSPCMWWMRWNVLQQRLGEEKAYEGSKFICPPDYYILFPRLSFFVPIKLKLEICHMWWQKKTKSNGTVPTGLKGHLQEGSRSQPQKEIKPPSHMYWIHLNCFTEKKVWECAVIQGGQEERRWERERS